MDTTAGTAVAMAGMLLLTMITPAGSEPGAPGGHSRGPFVPVLRAVQNQYDDPSQKGFSAQDISGRSDQSLPVRITLPPGRFVEFSYLMFRGLPDGVEMSTGFPLKESWVVSLKEASKLVLTAPEGFSGSFQVEASLFAGRDSPPEKRVINVDIRPAATAGRGQSPDVRGYWDLTSAPLLAMADPSDRTSSGGPQRPEAPVRDRPAARSISSQEEALLGRAEEAIKSGDISAARLLYEHLARQGSAKGAFAMGQTYDPEFLRTLFVKGLKPDAAKAREWYGKARELGHSGAGLRLLALSVAD